MELQFQRKGSRWAKEEHTENRERLRENEDDI